MEKVRNFLDWILESHPPRLLVVGYSPGGKDPDHDQWVSRYIERQTVAGRNFLLASNMSHPAAITMTVINSHYTPLQWSNRGFVEDLKSEFGVFTDVNEIYWTLQDHLFSGEKEA